MVTNFPLMIVQWRYTPDQIFLFFFWMTGKIAIPLPDDTPAQLLEVLSRQPVPQEEIPERKSEHCHQILPSIILSNLDLVFQKFELIH